MKITGRTIEENEALWVLKHCALEGFSLYLVQFQIVFEYQVDFIQSVEVHGREWCDSVSYVFTVPVAYKKHVSNWLACKHVGHWQLMEVYTLLTDVLSEFLDCMLQQKQLSWTYHKSSPAGINVRSL